ncbi:MAG: acyl-[acyl-carrier-protein] thioesterase [Saprospiraceae bacterium]
MQTAVPENKFKFTIKSFEANKRQSISIPALVSLMQEAAMQNAANFGASVANLQTIGVSWVLNRFRLNMLEYPRVGEEIMIKTYPVRMDKFFVLRDYLIYNQERRLVGSATSNWFVLDMDKRTMAQIPDFIREIQLPIIETPQAALAGKLRAPLACDIRNDFKAHWHDLDFNLHVSNISYFRWLAESVADGYLDTHEMEELDITFKGECNNNDIIITETQRLSETNFSHRLMRQEDNKDLVWAKSSWRLVPEVKVPE